MYYIKGKGNTKPKINHKAQINWVIKNTNFKKMKIEKHSNNENIVSNLKHQEEYNSKDKDLSEDDIWDRIVDLSNDCDGSWKKNLNL